MMMNYKVYCHISPNNKVYIGITQQEPKQRWQGGNGYRKNLHFYSAIKKYGWNNFKHIILFDKLTKEEAEKKEIELIKQYNSTNRKYGYNIENGGTCVGKVSDETKLKLRETRIGEKNPRYRKPQSENQKKSLLEANSVEVYQINKNNGLIINKYDSIAIAAKKMNICYQSISKCCRNKCKTAGGFIWTYANEYEEEIKYRLKKVNIKSDSKKVAKKDKNTNEIIHVYKSITEANSCTKVGISHISECCKGKRKTAGGFIWCYIYD